MRSDHECRSLQRHRPLIRRGLALGWLALIGLGVPAFTQDAGPVAAQTVVRENLSVKEAQEFALTAFAAGRFDLTLQVAEALIARDPRDPSAHYLAARALMQLGRLDEAQAAGKRAYRAARSQEQEYEAAQLTAQAAFHQDHFTSAQWWLRRASQAAPDVSRRARSIAEFQSVKQRNPFRFQFSFSAVPSDNVNNGSEGAFNTIDGVPYVGALSADAQALSGVIAEAGVDLSYRLRQTARSETRIGLSAETRKIALSRSAKASLNAAAIPEPDLDAEKLEVQLTHSLGLARGRQRLSFGLALGRSWPALSDPENYVRLSTGFRASLAPRYLLDVGLSAEQRERAAGAQSNVSILSLRTAIVHQRGNGDTVSVVGFGSRYNSTLAGRSSTTVGAVLGYTPARKFGPAQIAGSIGVQTATFSDYSLAGITVPGGRRDTSAFGEVRVSFPKIDYAGFTPELTLQHKATRSNVSRFQGKATSLTLGIKSLF